MSRLLELADRCEKATGSDRELDAEIDVAVRAGPGANFPAWVYTNFPTWRARAGGRVEVVHHDGTGGVHWTPRPYTSSLDAAWTLVQEGWRWQVSDRAPAPHKGRAYLHNDQLHFANHMRPNPEYKYAEVTAATPALALCAAALRARSHKGSEQ